MKLFLISGGTAFNSVVQHLAKYTDQVVYCLPTTDNGGSSAEITRVLGGPAVGDVRSRLTRLALAANGRVSSRSGGGGGGGGSSSTSATVSAAAIEDGAASTTTEESTDTEVPQTPTSFTSSAARLAIPISPPLVMPEEMTLEQRQADEQRISLVILFQHRLSDDPSLAREEFLRILNDEHVLWTGIGDSCKELVRSFFRHFDAMLPKAGGGSEHGEQQHGQQQQQQQGFNFARACVGNFFFTGARLFFNSLPTAIYLWCRMNGVPPETKLVTATLNETDRLTLGAELENGEVILGQNEISHPGHTVDKDGSGLERLSSPIKRIYYINEARQEVHLTVNPDALSEIDRSDVIFYTMGSIFTSICASLVLKGVGERIAYHSGKKVLLLNGFNDRESGNLTASGFVETISRSCCQAASREFLESEAARNVTSFVTHILIPHGCEVVVDTERLAELGVTWEYVESKTNDKGRILFQEEALAQAMIKCR